MLWFFIAITGYVLLSCANILDKFILTKSVPDPAILTFYSTIVMFGILILYPFGGELLVGKDWVFAIASGIFFGVALFFLFDAIKSGEQSHITPFNGAAVSIFTYWFSSLFLQEYLRPIQILGIIVLVVASLILAFEKSKKHNGFHIGFLWAAISGMLFAASHVTAKYIYTEYSFLTGLIWTKVGMALVGVFLLASPSVINTFRKKQKPKKKKKQQSAKKYALVLVYTSKLFAMFGVFLVQYAISIGSVSLVTAMAGIQYVSLFILIALFTKFAPKIFKEDFTKKEIIVEIIGICLVVIGSALFVL